MPQKILIVSTCPTHPTTAGNRRFILDQTEQFLNMGHEVFFLFVNLRNTIKQEEDDETVSSLKDYWGDRFFIYHQSNLQKLWSSFITKYRQHLYNGYNKIDDRYPYRLHHTINKLDAQYHFDVCLVNYFFLTKALIKIKIPKKGLITHDYFAYKSILVGDRFVLNNLTANEEAIAMQRSPYIFALNEGEAEYFQRLSPLSRVLCIYGSFVYRKSPIVGNHNILFLSGPNSYNINGLKWFLDNIFDSIIERFPNAKLYVGGAICSVISNWKLNANINLVGVVSNSADFYALGDVVINPTYQGTGLKIKTFEAVSFDKVLLTHPHSKIGIYKKDESPIFASDKAKDWVSFLDDIWGDIDKIKAIKDKNKRYFEQMNAYIDSQYKVFFYS